MNALTFPDGNRTMQSENESAMVRRILQHRQSHVRGFAFAKIAHVARQRLCVVLHFEDENFLTTTGMKQFSHIRIVIRIVNDTKHLALMSHMYLADIYLQERCC